jgi:hypothetical protein
MNEISILKNFVCNSTNLNEPLNYFFDLVDENKLFKLKGHRKISNLNKYDELVIIGNVVKEELNKWLDNAAEVLIPIFYEIPKEHFYHGMLMSTVLDIPLTILYFSDIQTGVFAFTHAGETKMSRFILSNAKTYMNQH